MYHLWPLDTLDNYSLALVCQNWSVFSGIKLTYFAQMMDPFAFTISLHTKFWRPFEDWGMKSLRLFVWKDLDRSYGMPGSPMVNMYVIENLRSVETLLISPPRSRSSCSSRIEWSKLLKMRWFQWKSENQTQMCWTRWVESYLCMKFVLTY